MINERNTCVGFSAIHILYGLLDLFYKKRLKPFPASFQTNNTLFLRL